MKIRTARHKFIIEKEYNGFRCMAHKSKEGVKLFSAHKDMFELKFLTSLISELSEREFLIDGVLVAYHGKDPLGETSMADIIENNHVPPSITVKFHVFDMVFYDGVDISDFPLHKRKALLNHLKFNSSIKNVYSLIVTTKEDLERSAKLFCSMTGSKGAVIKEYGSTYNLGEWMKFSKTQKINATVISAHELASSHYYVVGTPVRGVNHILRPNFLSVIDKEPFLELGKTQPTKLLCKRGDVIELEVTGVMKHEWYSNGELSSIRYSIYNPTILALADEEPSTIDTLKKLSESQNNRVVENMDLILEETNPDSEGGTLSKVALEFWNQNWKNLYPPNGEGRFTFQHHWQGLSEEERDLDHTKLLERGRSVHGDLRFSATQDAWAFTILEGSVRDIPKEGECSNFIAIAHSHSDKIQAHPKNRSPIEWLNMGKDKAGLIQPGNPGATADKWAKVMALDYGGYSAGTWTDGKYELFMDGKNLKGRMIIENTQVGENDCWLVSFPENQQPFASTHSKEKAILEMGAAGKKHLIWNNPQNSEAPEIIDLK